ncbi:GCRV induced gene 2i protein [Labeo rohita]|uniref:GCRV induced gene 2i protein n=1 Tax=Labeo rohita TaxID=84645 RepID=A0A498NI52_LABRO|nr:GCRV induced gene 2i protein [Labeo rohita]RXN31535.1 GCRV induced gene 2i protein [Labeo rohita]
MNGSGANMWAEDDLGPGAPPSLQSYTAPEQDKVYIMYHGTHLLAALQILQEGFRPSSNGMLGRGVYLSRDLQKASRYPLNLPEIQRVIVRVKVNVGRVKKIDRQGHPLQKTWNDHGFTNMWAESDLYPGVPCLESTKQPEDNYIYRMYHGTTEEAAEQIKIHGFQPSADGMLGHGIYLS